MYRFLLRPRWLIGHVLVAALAVLFVSLGLWQLSRHEQEVASTARITERLDQPRASLEQLVSSESGEDLAYRRVTVTGHYLPREEVLLSPRKRHGRAGHHVLTPLVLSDGRAVLVNRGWVPYSRDDPPVADAAPPESSVEVSGVLLPDQPAQGFSPERPEGDLNTVSRVDTARLQPQVAPTLLDYYVQLQRQRPAQAGALPKPAEPPDVEGAVNHFSYAVQWFSFAAVGLAGYPLLIRRAARSHSPRD